MHLLEACDAIQDDDSQLALTNLNLVARALDSITGNLTSSSAAVGNTSTSTAGNANTTGSGQAQSSNSTNPLDQLRDALGLD
jgi:hypothetical protein